jgi:hypothetical protein
MILQAMPATRAVTALWSSARRFRYQAQDCPLTLRQAADEYRQGHPDALQEDRLSGESTALFRSHDICHVIFGLETTVSDEVLADFWTIFGTDIGLRRYLRYLRETPEAKERFRAIGYGRSVLWTIRAVPQVVEAWLRSRQMSKKWPWLVPDSFWMRPLGTWRREFNIRII